MNVEILGKEGPKIVSLNRRKAIRYRCLDCSSFNHAELFRCSEKACPLFPFRSGQGKQNPKARIAAIRNYCLWCAGNQHLEMMKCPAKDCALFPYRKASTDKSVEVPSLPKKGHIQAVSEAIK